MDESWAEGVALPNSVPEHLSASVLRNQDKQKVTKEDKSASVLTMDALFENRIKVHIQTFAN